MDATDWRWDAWREAQRWWEAQEEGALYLAELVQADVTQQQVALEAMDAGLARLQAVADEERKDAA